MNFIKKALLITMSTVVIASALVGCSGGDTTWILKNDKTTLSTGIYVSNLIESYYQGSALVADSQSDILKQQIEGKDASQWISEKAMLLTKENFATENKFNELGLTLPETVIANITQTVDSQWEASKEIYEKNGISKDSVNTIMKNYYMSNAIFEKLYTADGEYAVTEDELKKVFSEKYYKTNYVITPLLDAEGKALDDTKKAELRATVTKYYDRIKAGEDFDIVAKELELESIVSTGGTEADLHPHEGVDVHALVIAKDGTDGFPEKFVAETSVAPIGELKTFEDETFIYITQNMDIMSNSDNFEQMKPAILFSLKGEDFTALMKDWVAANEANLKINKSTINKFTPKGLILQ